MKLLFLMFLALAWLVSKMPDKFLYALSSMISFLLRYIIRYRNNIIKENIKNSFPAKDNIAIKRIIREYYQHLADLIVEVLKTPGLTANQIKSRFTFRNSELLEKFSGEKRSVIILTAHMGNWEWLGPGFQLNFPDFEGSAVVKPLSNPYFNDYINNLRMIHRNDSVIPFKQTLRYMIRNKEKLTLTLFAADQTPHRSEIVFNAPFLNQPTPFFTGFEKIAKMLDQPVIFTNVYRIRKGYYEVNFELITDQPKNTDEYEITLKYIQMLEKAIYERPYNWLWSHRRWKYAPKNPETQITEQN